MMDGKRKLTLDFPATYQIKVPGELDERWTDWNGEISVTIACDRGGSPITTLTGTFDQATLQSLLRRLYSLGLPLISVNWIDVA